MNPRLIVLPKGATVIRSLQEWCSANGVSAASITAIGAIENAEICYYDLPTKSYLCQTVSEAMEVLSLAANVTLREGKPFVHAHVTLGDRQMNVKGGHLKEATVAVTLECVITALQENPERKHNEDIGLFLLPPSV